MPYRTPIFLIIAVGLTVWALWGHFMSPSAEMVMPVSEIPASSGQQVTPLPLQVSLDPAKVRLGRQLFHDPRLSRDNTISCAFCHDLRTGGMDSQAHAVGIDGRVGELNSPTVFNSGFNFRQFWDGRASTLEEQAAGPVHSPIEMDSSWEQVIDKLTQDPVYLKAFDAIWGEPVKAQHIQSALATFQRSLITPNAPFDRFLRGDSKALSEEAHRGWDLFRNMGCISCHQGVNIGGNMFANLGVMGDYFSDLDRPLRPSDMGRYNVTGHDADRHLFKVPSLRNIARTAPYFHDGSVESLGEAVEIMARYQLGVLIDESDRDALLAFLNTLNGDMPEAGL